MAIYYFCKKGIEYNNTITKVSQVKIHKRDLT